MLLLIKVKNLKVNIHLLWLLQNLMMQFALSSRVHVSANFEKNIYQQ